MPPDYSNREIDRMFCEITDTLKRIETQTVRTNGRVSKLEKIMLIVVTALLVSLSANGSEVLKLLTSLL